MKFVNILAILPLALSLVACAAPQAETEIFDPYESTNRKVHEFNKGFDRAILRPTANFYGETVPAPARNILNNLASHIELSGDIVNDIFQARGEDAIHNSFRFAINSTLGVAGLFDPAASFGLEQRETGFGETLYTWGADEGAYISLPFLGPSTTREAVGRFADFFTNAFSYALDGPSAIAAASVGGIDIVNDRYAIGPTIDATLYESQDSYVTARGLYLQNLRFRYSGGELDEQTVEIYDELYAN